MKTLSTSNALVFFATAIVATPVFAACNRDNCLRALVAKSSSALAFCSSYIAATATANTAHPTLPTACLNSPTRVSSACKCLLTPTPTSTSTSPRLCKPSTVMNAKIRNGAFDQIPIPEGGSAANMPPWYFDRLSNTVGDFRGEAPGPFSGGGAAAFHLAGQPPGSFAGYGYLNNPITYCAEVNYTISFAGRQAPRNSASDQRCRLAVFTPFGDIAELEEGSVFTYDFQRFGPFLFSIFRDNGEHNADGTWNDTLSLIVQCFGIIGRPATDVLFEVDNIFINVV